jgi:SAM-dependent methyltransferase
MGLFRSLLRDRRTGKSQGAREEWNPGVYNTSWEAVYEWFAANLIVPGDESSRFVGVKEGKALFETDRGIVEYLVIGNVICFRAPEHDKEQEYLELTYWRNRSSKEWQDYSKYDYHILSNLPHLLKRAGLPSESPYCAFDTILDIGCGPYGFAKWFNAAKFKIGADALAHLYPKICSVRSSFPKVSCYAEALPFRGESFDFAISTNALDHFREWNVALREIARCIRPGGFFFVDVDCKTRDELDEIHQVTLDPDDVLGAFEKLRVDLGYIQIGPRRPSRRRLIVIGRKAALVD